MQTNVTNQSIFRIYGKIFSHPYDWGADKLIPQTLGFTPEPNVPYAEYWIGTHEKAPATVILNNGEKSTLTKLINGDPATMLGNTVAKRYGDIPFLYKLLDAREMLSLQVHPNKQQAEEGYAREESAGIPRNDAKRTYKDANHKPEFAIAQDDFWLLHGFKQPQELKKTLAGIAEFAELISLFGEDDYKKLYIYIMKDMPEATAQEILGKLAERILPLYTNGKLTKSEPDYWAAKAIKYMDMKSGAYDRGLFSIYLLNIVHLKPGEGIFQDANLLHSYLEGPIIEVMATSDNVARGGITPKYVDVDELIKLVTFSGITPNIIKGETTNNEKVYRAPINEFQISQIQATKKDIYKHTSYSAELLMVLLGNCTIVVDDQEIILARGESVFIQANTIYEIHATEEDIIFKTSVPENNLE